MLALSCLLPSRQKVRESPEEEKENGKENEKKKRKKRKEKKEKIGLIPSSLFSLFLSLVLLQHFSSKLTPFEMSEVLDFPKMYFFGQNANKIKGIPWAQNNNGSPALLTLALLEHRK